MDDMRSPRATPEPGGLQTGHEHERRSASGASSFFARRAWSRRSSCVQVVLGLGDAATSRTRRSGPNALHPGRHRRSTSISSRSPGSSRTPTIDLARLKRAGAGRASNRYGWVDREGRDRPHPDRSGDGHPRPEGPAEGRRAAARRGSPAEYDHPAGRNARRPDRASQPAREADEQDRRSHAEAIRILVIADPAVDRRGRARRRGERPRPGDGHPGSVVSQVGFDQKLGARLPLDLRFRDEAGREVRLGDYFGRRPVILALVYYRCPLLCNQVLNGLTRSLEAALARRRQGLRRRGRQHQPGRDARAGGAEEGGVPGALRPARDRGGLALPDGRSRRRSTRWPGRSGSATRTTRGPSSMPTPRASSS